MGGPGLGSFSVWGGIGGRAAVPAVAVVQSGLSAPSRPWAWPCQGNTGQAEVKVRDREGQHASPTHPLGIEPVFPISVPGKNHVAVVGPRSLRLRHEGAGAPCPGPLDLDVGRDSQAVLRTLIPLLGVLWAHPGVPGARPARSRRPRVTAPGWQAPCTVLSNCRCGPADQHCNHQPQEGGGLQSARN